MYVVYHLPFEVETNDTVLIVLYSKNTKEYDCESGNDSRIVNANKVFKSPEFLASSPPLTGEEYS